MWELGIPVPGNFERRIGRKVVLLVVRPAGDIGMGIPGAAVVVDGPATGIERSERSLIDKIMPISVGTRNVAMVDANQKCLQWLLTESREYQPETHKRGGKVAGVRWRAPASSDDLFMITKPLKTGNNTECGVPGVFAQR